MNKDSKIFIAGHRGLVGSAIVRRLESDGYSNLLLRTSSEVDLRNQAAVNDLFEGEKPDYVFLAAAKVGGIYANDTFPADFIRDNLQIQTNVIDASYRNGVVKLLFLGSSCVYPKLAPQPMPESCLLTGDLELTNEWYAIAKIAGIKMCQAYRRQYGFNAISLMPTNLYGPNDNYDLNNSHVLPALMRKFHLAKLAGAGDLDSIRSDELRYGVLPSDVLEMLGLVRNHHGEIESLTGVVKVKLWGSGSAYREFLYVDDLADACLYLMGCYDSDVLLNIGVGKDITIRELACLVQRVVGFDGEVVWDGKRPDGAPRKLLDVTQLNATGWKAEVTLIDGLHLSYQGYLSN